MEWSSGLAASRAAAVSLPIRRLHYRHPIQSLVYVTLDEGNGGIIRNLSQDGAAIQAVAALRPGQSLRMRFDLLNPRARVDVHAEVSWANRSGQAGLRFVDLSAATTRQLNDWIFVSLLRGLEHSSPVLMGGTQCDDLILSPSARPAIRLPNAIPSALSAPAAPADEFLLSWWPRPLSLRSLATLMDGLVLFSAVLTFFCIFLAVAHTLPAWPVATAVVIGVSGFFTALYWLLCSLLGCGTAGVQLAKLAVGETEAGKSSRDGESRFR